MEIQNPPGDSPIEEARWRWAFESTDDGLWDWDTVSNQVYFSPKWKSMLGHTEGEIGDSLEEWTSRVHPDDLPACMEELQKHFRGEAPIYSNEHRVRCKDGSYKWILDRGKVMEWLEPGKPKRVVGTHKDITFRRDQIQALAQASALQSGILENAGHAIIAGDLNGIITLFNPAAERLLGYRTDELVGLKTPAIFHDGEEVVRRAAEFSRELGILLEPGFEVFVAKARRGLPNQHEWTYLHKDGTRIQVLLNVTAIRDPQGEVTGFLGLAVDLTSERKAEMALRKLGETATQAVFERTAQQFALDQHAIVAVTDFWGKITYANDKFCQLSGYSREDLVGRDHRMINSDFHPKEFFREMFKTIRSGLVWHGQIRNRAKNGKLYWVDTTIVPTRNAEGEIQEFVSIRTDITGLMAARTEILAGQTRFKAVLDAIPDLLFEIDSEEVIHFYHSPSADLLAVPAAVFMHKRFSDVLPPGPSALIRTALHEAGLSGYSSGICYSLILPDGKEAWFEISISRKAPLPEEGERYVVVARDITTRRIAEAEHKRIAERLSMACAAGGIGIWEYAIPTNELIWDDDMFKLYGITRGDFKSTYEAWYSGLHPEDRQRGLLEIQRAVAGEKEFDTEFRVVWPDGSIRNIRALGRLIPNADGKPRMMIGTNWDITSIKQTEADLEAAKVKAENATRAKSDFLASMSHEIRTPMNGVLGITQLLAETRLDAEQRGMLDTIQTSGETLMAILNDILDFSKIEAGKLDIEFTEIDIRKSVTKVIDLLDLQAKNKGIGFKVVFEEGLPHRMTSDPVRFQQILMNLTGNALKFTAMGEVVIRLSALHGLNAIKVEICDTGIGIPEDKQRLLFQKFSQVDASTTRKFGGSGLGLAITRKLVELMGGEIGFESKVGHGSRFWFRIPVGAESARLEGGIPALNPEARRPEESWIPVRESFPGARVLVVEDSEVNQKVAMGMLRKLGCVCDLACNGQEAVDMSLRSHYDLILMDCEMPVKDGWDATREIRGRESESGTSTGDKAHSRLPILALTAHALGWEESRCRDSGMDDVLTKPIKKETLRRALETWLPRAKASAL